MLTTYNAEEHADSEIKMELDTLSIQVDALFHPNAIVALSLGRLMIGGGFDFGWSHKKSTKPWLVALDGDRTLFNVQVLVPYLPDQHKFRN